MKTLVLLASTLVLGGCARTVTTPNATPISASTSASSATPTRVTLAQTRRAFKTKLTRRESEKVAVSVPPAKLFRTVFYPSTVGKMAAYLGVDPRDGKKHPAIIWIFGGFGNSIDNSAWTPAPADNDQSAGAFRQAGIVMMYPSLRGGNRNPGFKEGFGGEVDDVLAAAKFLAAQPYIDAKRIYLGGHSTGGTLALLCAEMPNTFRGVFAFGPVASAIQYGDEYMPFDTKNKRETDTRAPMLWMNDVSNRTWVFEGREQPGNADVVELMRSDNTNSNLKFALIPRASHFSVLAPMTKLIAQKIVRDNGAKINIAFSQKELDGLMR